MNKRLEEFKENIKGMKIDVLGIGISNLPIIKYLKNNGAEVTAFDKREKADLGDVYEELFQMGVKFSLGENYLDNIYGDMVIKTPGMRFDNPKLLEAK